MEKKLNSKTNSRLPAKGDGQKLDGPVIDVLDVDGQAVEKMVLPEGIFDVRSNPGLIAQAVHKYLVNQRKGTASTKTRGEVVGTTKKMYRQKHTGRARHGAETAPIFVGGGVAHGPLPKQWWLALPKSMARRALFTALADKLRQQQAKVVVGLENLPPKTKAMTRLVDRITGVQKMPTRTTLLVVGEKLANVEKASRNIPYLTVERAPTLNTYTVVNSQLVLFTKDAIEQLYRTFIKEKVVKRP